MRVRHLNCATMRPLSGPMVCHCLLVETEAGLVLVDSGLGLADVADPRGRLGRGFTRVVRPVLDESETAVRQVVALGYAVEDVRHIVLTHLDLDHAGGISDFPRARVHVYGTEYRAAMSPGTIKERSRYRARQWAHGPAWAVYDEGGEPWFGFGAVRQLDGLPPEILIIPLAGHSRGHAGVAVDTGSGWLLHAGDAYFHRGEADPDRTRSTAALRVFQSVVEHERRARLANQRRLRELVGKHRAEVAVFCAHDRVELARFGTAGPVPQRGAR